MSYSNGLALIAGTRHAALGVDIERVRSVPEADQIAAKFFSPREGAMLHAIPAEQKMEAFFHCWTRKEAYLKATGEGIADALPRIEVSLGPGQPARLLRINGDTQAAQAEAKKATQSAQNAANKALNKANKQINSATNGNGY